jgi:NADH-quinone oxidoreductase subunit G
MYTKGIAELAPEPYIAISKFNAEEMKLDETASVTVKSEQQQYTLPIKIHPDLSKGIALVPKMVEGLSWGSFVEVMKESEVGS